MEKATESVQLRADTSQCCERVAVFTLLHHDEVQHVVKRIADLIPGNRHDHVDIGVGRPMSVLNRSKALIVAQR